MSRRNRKFRTREFVKPMAETDSTSASAAAVPHSRTSLSAVHAGEYRNLKRELIRVVVLNTIILAALLALYYANQQSRIVERTYHQLF